MNTKLQILGKNITQQDNQIQNLDNKNSQQDNQIQNLINKLKKIETDLNGKSKQTIPPQHGQKSRTQLIFYSIRNLQIRLSLTSSASCFTS